MVDGMLWRTAGKLARYVGELVVPEPLDAVRRNLYFLDSQRRILCMLELAPVSVLM